jgi:hypothetical protein
MRDILKEIHIHYVLSFCSFAIKGYKNTHIIVATSVPVVGLEGGPLSLVRIIEELLEWESSGSGLENRY